MTPKCFSCIRSCLVVNESSWGHDLMQCSKIKEKGSRAINIGGVLSTPDQWLGLKTAYWDSAQ